MVGVSDALDAFMLAIVARSYRRWSGDAASPMREETVEAPLGVQQTVRAADRNAVVGMDARWAAAYVLHFFAATERAAPLLRYNKHASRFVKDGWLPGAYGAGLVPQLRRCVQQLAACPESRRAIATLPGLDGYEDINRPACISCVHLLGDAGFLNMLVYQRSLNVVGVGPYDGVLLSNVFRWACAGAGMMPGDIVWTVGSAHCTVRAMDSHTGYRASGERILLPVELLSDAAACYAALEEPERLPEPYCSWLSGDEEVRL